MKARLEYDRKSAFVVHSQLRQMGSIHTAYIDFYSIISYIAHFQMINNLIKRDEVQKITGPQLSHRLNIYVDHSVNIPCKFSTKFECKIGEQ